MYVDVHKAIRRLTPAPRARRFHTHSHGHNEAATAATAAAIASKKPGDNPILVDIAEDSDGQTLTVGSFGAQSDSGCPEHHPKTAIFMKRRSSSGPDGGPEGGGPIPVKASLDEMKQQLRLGPANRAAKPRNTRTNVFKIKQGLGVTTLISPAGNGKPIEEIPPVVLRQSVDDNEETPLLARDSASDDGPKWYGADGANGTKGTNKKARDDDEEQ